MALVSFIVAGVQKAGTTALFDYLQDHAEIGLPTIKEPHFFDNDELDWATPDYVPYHNLFPDVHGTKLLGEATPITIYWPGSNERALAYNPHMKFIVMLRNPMERAFSHWRMEHKRGDEAEPFSYCIRQGRKRVSAEPSGHHRNFSYVERGFYADQLDRLCAQVARTQVLILDAEALDIKPHATLNRIAMFLGVSKFEHVLPRRVHEGTHAQTSLVSEDHAYLKALYANDMQRLQNHYGFDIGRWNERL